MPPPKRTIALDSIPPEMKRSDMECQICGAVRKTLVLVSGKWRCVDCAVSWRITKNGKILRLEVWNR